MTFAEIEAQVSRMKKEQLKALVDAAESVAVGSADRLAESVASDVLCIVRTTHPELLH